MVNLIITLISIALIAIVAVAALYNGGDAFRQGSAKASAAQLVNAGQQISAANVLYANDHGGTYATELETLTLDSAYLSSTPRVPQNYVVDESLVHTKTLEDGSTSNVGNVVKIENAEASQEICEAVNQQAGYGDEVILADEAAVTLTFGCVGGDVGPTTFYFK